MGFGIINHARDGSKMLARLKNIPVYIITLDLCFKPWNSLMYDIKTAKGPQILKEFRFKNVDRLERKLPLYAIENLFDDELH